MCVIPFVVNITDALPAATGDAALDVTVLAVDVSVPEPVSITIPLVIFLNISLKKVSTCVIINRLYLLYQNSYYIFQIFVQTNILLVFQ